MPTPQPHPLVKAIEAGESVEHAKLASLGEFERSAVTETLLATASGRRWLRRNPAIDAEQADKLLAFESDFCQPRRDRTLFAVIEQASLAAITSHAAAIAAGPAAPALWRRLAADRTQLVAQASTLVASTNTQAAEATLHLLVLDPLDPFGIGNDDRLLIAASALESGSAGVRGLATEHLAEHDPAVLQRALEQLLSDESERVRGTAWDAALRVDRSATIERATDLLGDESAPVPWRRSALVALGTALPTAQMAELLSYFVVHLDHELAADAAILLYRQHRNPITAEAARDSPHADVRELAEQLLDPLRGSPAAGGSRPGDPTGSSADIYADMIRQLEAKAENQNDSTGR